MTNVRVLTYNVQCRSWGMEVLAQGTLTPTTSAEERAREISKRILNSYRTWDIVCLNEVFDEDAREVFIAELGAEYPEQIQKCDVDNLGLQLGITAAAAGLIAIPGIGWLAAIGIAVGALALLAETKYEDSGLMVFSRLPFVSDPIPASMVQFLQDAGITGLSSIPRVAFVPYEEATEADKFAAKGVVYAAFKRPDGETLHLLASHTQADPLTDIGKNATVRKKQLDRVLGLLDQFASTSEEVLVCGDLNIYGTHDPGSGPRQEWKDIFATSGSRFTDELVDSWYREQCPGEAAFGGTPLPPDTFDRGVTANGNQRLDYLIRSLPGFPGRLIGQHLAIPWEVANGTGGSAMYTSDHLPLSIDYHAMHAKGTAMLAQPLDFEDPAPGQFPPDQEVNGSFENGQMHWYRVDRKGAYGFKFDKDGPCAFEVYTADNLSVSHAPFRLLTDPPDEEMPFGVRFVLPSAPFYIRVFPLKRNEGASYTLRIHRFAGTSEADAIGLRRGIEEHFTPKAGAPHSPNLSTTPWDEMDSVWFCAPFDTRQDGSLTVESTITVRGDLDAFGLLVLSEEAGQQKDLVAQEGSGSDPVVGRHVYNRPAAGFFLVRRETGSPFPLLSFSILLESDVTYLYSKPSTVPGALVGPATHAKEAAQLTCIDETDGFMGSEWGSDDIQINLSSNGDLLVHIPHSDDLDFDDDTERELPQLDGIRYIGGADFELVELDDFSPVDRASVHLPPFKAVQADPSLVTNPGDGSTLVAKFRVVFDEDDDDGIYDLSVSVSQEPPPQKP